ncbi:MAG: hypothetical protein HYR51_20040 [Candidatus Rokubacteria bacterium]|nr:hypothetical protein [Candidatus Rokubacteria bacterium]
MVAALNAGRVRYALAGGVAVSIYASPRATEDVDFLIAGDDLDTAVSVLSGLGFRVAGAPMDVAGGRLRIHRLLKFEGAALLPVDLLIPQDPALGRLVDERSVVDWEGEQVAIVTVDGLRTLKKLRGSAQDRADLEALGPEP